jgi:hypothetical protein
MSNYIVFVPDEKTNLYVPLVDINKTPIENKLPPLIPSRQDPKNMIYDYYMTPPAAAAGNGVNMPEDRFIRYYYTCLSIIGLYVLYRITKT